MIAISSITMEASKGLGQRDAYILIKTSQGTFSSKVQSITGDKAEWELTKDRMVISPEENCNLIVVELWDYDAFQKIGKLSFPGLAYGDVEKRKRTYNGFITGKKQEEIRVKIDYEWMNVGRESGEGKKGRQTKRTDYTQSNNSISNLMEPQPSYASKLYSSLLRSLSQRHIDILQANNRAAIAPYKSPPKQLPSKRNRQIA